MTQFSIERPEVQRFSGASSSREVAHGVERDYSGVLVGGPISRGRRCAPRAKLSAKLIGPLGPLRKEDIVMNRMLLSLGLSLTLATVAQAIRSVVT